MGIPTRYWPADAVPDCRRNGSRFWSQSASEGAAFISSGAAACRQGLTAEASTHVQVAAGCRLGCSGLFLGPGWAGLLAPADRRRLAGAGKGYVDVSTIDVGTAQEIAAAVRGAGGRYIEAPVSGSKGPAEQGALIFLTAGAPARPAPPAPPRPRRCRTSPPPPPAARQRPWAPGKRRTSHGKGTPHMWAPLPPHGRARWPPWVTCFLRKRHPILRSSRPTKATARTVRGNAGGRVRRRQGAV